MTVGSVDTSMEGVGRGGGVGGGREREKGMRYGSWKNVMDRVNVRRGGCRWW